jgi:hypothetical protein
MRLFEDKGHMFFGCRRSRLPGERRDVPGVPRSEIYLNQAP